MAKLRQHFSDELRELYQQILRMGSLVEEALEKAITALNEGDLELARAVVEGDKEIDRIHIEVEDEATRIIAMEQPVATDLRELITVTKIAADLERIGDHARHIAKTGSTIPAEVIGAALGGITSMARIGVQMVHDSLSAFVEQDAEKAREVAERDDAIDEEHHRLYKLLITLMQNHPQWIDHGVSLMFLNRFLERLGDHVTNMCEWVIFAKTGNHLELNK